MDNIRENSDHYRPGLWIGRVDQLRGNNGQLKKTMEFPDRLLDNCRGVDVNKRAVTQLFLILSLYLDKNENIHGHILVALQFCHDSLFVSKCLITVLLLTNSALWTTEVVEIMTQHYL